MIRAPRDILVSAYYSFGTTHTISKVEKVQSYQISRRDHIQALSIDEYVFEEAVTYLSHFETVHRL